MVCADQVSQSTTDRSSSHRKDDNTASHERNIDESEALPPDRALSILGNETRIAILRVLGSADEEVVPFSTLRKRVGIEDSGQFNYHLNQLAGHYIRHTPDGYALCQAGTDALEVISRL